MTPPNLRLTITAKLLLSLLVFVLIFYGTIVHVFFHIQKMMTISEEIVSIHNVVSGQSKVMLENLLEMDANAKKFILLNKDVYREYFDTAKENFDTALLTVSHLSARGYSFPESFTQFLDEYNHRYETLIQDSIDIRWVDEDTVNSWLALIARFRNSNEDRIEQSLMDIHHLTLKSTRNGLIGFGLSVIIAFIGILFISKSIILPLKQLTHGLRTLSQGDYSSEIRTTSKDEFSDLAAAFNEMNRELREEENLRADFIATLSHEIRTPLSSVKESVDMMAEELLGEVNDKQQKFLTIAGDEITRINELLDHLLHVSRLEVNAAQNRAEQMVAEDVIYDCTRGMFSQAEQKHITLHHSLPPGLPPIWGIREEIQQVLINIIGNAVKFSPNYGEIRINVLKSEKSGYVLFQVIDEGPGIPAEEHSLIFNKYYRSKSVRKHMDGVGLGLYISKRIIRGMGGTISVTNNPDKGSTFSFTIPSVAT